MKQAQIIKPGDLRFAEVPDPTAGQLAGNEILLRIRIMTICGGDIHVMHGQHPFVTYPVIQGHEYGAEVVAVGENVTKVKPGDKAAARPQLVCGECPPCRKGRFNICQNLRVQGFQAPGAAQKYFIVPEDRLIKMDDSLPYGHIALVEPCAVGVHAMTRTDIKGKNVVVTGAGTIGNLVAQCVQIWGANDVLITDVSDLRLEKARECGIRHTANTAKESFADAVRRVFGDGMFQAGFEVSGAQPCITDLVANMEKGGDIILVGVFSTPPVVDLAVVDEHEISIIGSMMYLHEDFETAAGLLRDGKIKVGPLVTLYFDFDNFAEAYAFIDDNREACMKVAIRMPE